MFKTINNLSIKNKAILIIVAVFMSLFVLVLLITGAVLNQSFLALEEQQVERNIVRVHNGIQSMFDSLNRTNADWAYWTETYEFVKGENDEYITDNLTVDTLYNLDVELMIFYDEHGELVNASIADFDAYEMVDPTHILTAIEANDWLFEHENLTASQTGFIETAEGLVMLTSRQILTNDQEGPVEGTLLIGDRFSDVRQQQLSEQINVKLTTIEWDQRADVAELPSSELLLNADDNHYIIPADQEWIYGYSLIYDQHENPLIILRTETTRQIYQQGRHSLNIYLFLLFVAGGVMIVVITVLLNQTVFKRIMQLEEYVTYVGNTDDLSKPLLTSSADEIGMLERGISAMVTALSASREKLNRYNQELEAEVAERTHSLNETVEKLEEEITLRKVAEHDASLARDQALEALRLKTQILANVSHDARTPLTVIGLRAEMLARGRYGELNERQVEVVNSIQDNNGELLQFINNLLEQARTGETEITPNLSTIKLKAWIEKFTQGIMPLVERKHLSLTINTEADMPDDILTDEEWLRNILNNLINNAIKFTEQGGITVHFSRHDKDHFAIDVSDTGIGIASKDIERIFEAFWQVDGTITRKANRGVGLGLSIVRNLTVLLDGEIMVTSEPGKGTTFTVILPLEIPIDERQML